MIKLIKRILIEKTAQFVSIKQRKVAFIFFIINNKIACQRIFGPK